MNTLGQNIKAARLAAGLTQADLAFLILVSPGAVSHYECGRTTPSSSVLLSISEAVGVSVEALVNGDGSTWTGRERVKRIDDFPDLDEDGELLLKRIWLLITDWKKKQK